MVSFDSVFCSGLTFKFLRALKLDRGQAVIISPHILTTTHQLFTQHEDEDEDEYHFGEKIKQSQSQLNTVLAGYLYISEKISVAQSAHQ